MTDRPGPILDSELALMLADSDQEVKRLRSQLSEAQTTIWRTHWNRLHGYEFVASALLVDYLAAHPDSPRPE